MNTKPNLLPVYLAAFAAGCLLLVAGCGGAGPPRAAVTGKVTFNNKPLPMGVVRFIPLAPNEGPKVSVIVTNGEFQAPRSRGPIVGMNRVEIESTDNGGYAMDDEQALADLKKSRKKIRVIRIPAVYNQRSELTANVKAGKENQVEFTLTN